MFKKYWISLLFSVTILVLCFINVSPIMPDLPMTNMDKIVHFLMFLGLSGVVFFDNTGYLKIPITFRRILFGSFFFPTVFSGIIELMQEYLTSARTGDWMDFLFDGIGASLGLLTCWIINRKL